MDVAPPIDLLSLARDMIRRPSVTPRDAGALDVLEAALKTLGFVCHRLPFGTAESGREARVDNLFARLGSGKPHFCFAGHTDVVPPGDAGKWSADPFAGEVKDGQLWGRGAADMKGAIAAFVAAADGFLRARGGAFAGSISLLITGDEEGDAVNGTTKVLDWMQARGEIPDMCVVGEPTNPERLGDMIKNGRRGSMTGHLTVTGVQGHTAYPHLADNPAHRLVRMLDAIVKEPLDAGSAHFQPSTLQVTTIDIGNPANNVIPGEARAKFNIRFNDKHSSKSITAWLRAKFDAAMAELGPGGAYTLDVQVSGESFFTAPGTLSSLVADCVQAETNRAPELSTTGGTSDARFIRRLCPVVEFGGVGQTMHKIDERMAVADLEGLARIYRRMLDKVFA
ncbi:MAG: succinyl-diaminopimelate desuccinylase [Rhodospirillaceae bacterium]|nr:succinyl-diaminopimelate desuccinylase [Rhodospirillaceae bacterium]